MSKLIVLYIFDEIISYSLNLKILFIIRPDGRSSKKILPHKKRISRKLRKNCPPSRKVHKCNLCEQIFNSLDSFMEHRQLCETTITPIHVAVSFTCVLCSAVFTDQLTFFRHLKMHYEPTEEQVAIAHEVRNIKNPYL